MQEDVANLLCKGCIAAATFEQTTQDVSEHHLISSDTYSRKTSLTHSGSFSVFRLYMIYIRS